MRKLVLSIMFLAGSVSAALASASAWQKTEGARLRVVTTGLPDADGLLRGALQIDLKPGWKTYWRDPGASGVPPSIDVSASPHVRSLEMHFPAPMRFDDAAGPWTGYKHSVSFPVTFRLATPEKPGEIAAEIFIGVCETVCVPFQARLSLDPASDPENADHAAIIEDAIAMLPAGAEADFGATPLSASEAAIEIAAAFPGDAGAAELFVAGVDGYALGVPEKRVAAGKAIFSLPILERPATKPQGKGLPYTLVTQAGAVQGFLPYP